MGFVALTLPQRIGVAALVLLAPVVIFIVWGLLSELRDWWSRVCTGWVAWTLVALIPGSIAAAIIVASVEPLFVIVWVILLLGLAYG